MAFVFMDLVYCNYAISIVIFFLALLTRVFLKNCKWLQSAFSLLSIGIKLIPLVMSWSATSKNVGLSLEMWQSFCALLWKGILLTVRPGYMCCEEWVCMMLQNNKNSQCFKHFACAVMLVFEKSTLKWVLVTFLHWFKCCNKRGCHQISCKCK